MLKLSAEVEFPPDAEHDPSLAHTYKMTMVEALREQHEELHGKAEWPLQLNPKAYWSIE